MKVKKLIKKLLEQDLNADISIGVTVNQAPVTAGLYEIEIWHDKEGGQVVLNVVNN